MSRARSRRRFFGAKWNLPSSSTARPKSSDATSVNSCPPGASGCPSGDRDGVRRRADTGSPAAFATPRRLRAGARRTRSGPYAWHRGRDGRLASGDAAAAVGCRPVGGEQLSPGHDAALGVIKTSMPSSSRCCCHQFIGCSGEAWMLGTIRFARPKSRACCTDTAVPVAGGSSPTTTSL